MMNGDSKEADEGHTGGTQGQDTGNSSGDATSTSGMARILFDASKRESHQPTGGFKKWYRKLRAHAQVHINKEPIEAETLENIDIVILGGPREQFTMKEIDTLKDFLNKGGSLLAMVGGGGEKRSGTNINFLLEQYGISVNNDNVMRSVYYKYLHPQEAFITNGLVNQDFKRICSTGSSQKTHSGLANRRTGETNEASEVAIAFVYPRGATLSVQSPAFTLATSGQISYPVNRPIMALSGESEDKRKKKTASNEGTKGRVAALGSCDIVADEWLLKEHNYQLLDVILKWLSRDSNTKISSTGTKETDISEHNLLPDTASLAERLRPCLQESEELPQNFAKLFDNSVFEFSPKFVPEAIKLYEQLGVTHEPLKLITPQFETPLPPMQPAVFPPTLREPPGPALDQFDLDEHFASERLRLAQLTNKCTDEDVDFYVKEAAEILGVVHQLPTDKRDSKHILEHVFRAVVHYKKLNQDEDQSDDEQDHTTEGKSPHKSPAKISDMFSSDLAQPSAGPAGMGPGVAAGFSSKSTSHT
eukprot:gb/GECG01015180.1/.p1 GENE.gb/GECG01015180.1/~~gb/GECG01015180.1/.p1  ORF type:complete len:532 (+),score=81.32 gb/GECG01015180.1/:1-1596(+)